MCGIAGIVNGEAFDLNKMIIALGHRGPDAQRLYRDNQVALIHTRLAIQDVQHGVQPFHYEHFSIIFNGEIYNHQVLRTYLTEFTFHTNSDTETLLYLFVKFRFKMFDMLDGMFAFCIYDNLEKKLIFGRDRAGKKPLYYTQYQQSFLFASELNAIKNIIPLAINSDAIYSYLRIGLIWRPYTAYQNVYKLEAGHYLVLDINTLKIEKASYFNILDFYQDQSMSNSRLDQMLSELDAKLKASIADRITASDVDVGVFLSGGIDSNLIAALAAEVKPNIKTFTVRFDGAYDESTLARLTANQFKTNHIELCISANLKNDIEKILLSYGEPFMDSSAIPSYYVSREAANHVKVVLSGDGADELFAGYRRYVPAAHNLSQYIRIISPLIKFLPKAKTKHSFYNYFYRLLAMSNKTGLDYYLSATTDVFEDVVNIKHSDISENLSFFINDVFANSKLSSLNKMLYTDYSVILFCDLLVKMDIASMVNSLEVRSPFLSKHLLEFAPGLADKFKINKIKTKYILRKLAEKYLPQELINQPKRGFEVPLKKWIDHDLRENIQDTLHIGCYAEEYVNRNVIQSILANKIVIPSDKRAKILWSLYCLEIWLRHGNFSNR